MAPPLYCGGAFIMIKCIDIYKSNNFNMMGKNKCGKCKKKCSHCRKLFSLFPVFIGAILGILFMPKDLVKNLRAEFKLLLDKILNRNR